MFGVGAGKPSPAGIYIAAAMPRLSTGDASFLLFTRVGDSHPRNRRTLPGSYETVPQVRKQLPGFGWACSASRRHACDCFWPKAFQLRNALKLMS